MEINRIYEGACLEIMKNIPDKFIDCIICDLPYGSSNCVWDTVIPFKPLWIQYKRIIKDNGAIVLFGCQPFTSMLINSNVLWFKYELIWHKSKCGSPLSAKYRPLAKHENILIFGKGKIGYNPEMLKGTPYKRNFTPMKFNNHKYGIKGAISDNKGTRYPETVIYFQQNWRRQDQMHPTQKPVKLIEYLIKTYTNEDDLILDNCIGSGTTAIACLNTNRNFIGIELNAEYVKITNERIRKHRKLF